MHSLLRYIKRYIFILLQHLCYYNTIMRAIFVTDSFYMIKFANIKKKLYPIIRQIHLSNKIINSHTHIWKIQYHRELSFFC